MSAKKATATTSNGLFGACFCESEVNQSIILFAIMTFNTISRYLRSVDISWGFSKKLLISIQKKLNTLPWSFAFRWNADHAFVMIFSSLGGKFHQPIATFASAEPVSGITMAQLAIQDIIEIKKRGGFVHRIFVTEHQQIERCGRNWAFNQIF